MDDSFDNLIAEAMNTPFEGWDFSFISDSGRTVHLPLKWNYSDILKPYVGKVSTLLDMGTGGGEFLSELTPLPPNIYATESYVPNVKIARDRLSPLGIEVVYVKETDKPPYNDDLPFEDSFFDLIINRHEAYSPCELKRILKKEGIFVTQQVGCFTAANLKKDMLGDKAYYENWNLHSAVNELERESFTILNADEHFSSIRFYDVGAIVYYLKAIPWIIDGFSPDNFRNELLYIHEHIKKNEYYEALNHRFIITAVK